MNYATKKDTTKKYAKKKDATKKGKHSARKPPKLIILLTCKTSSEMRKLKYSQAENLTS